TFAYSLCASFVASRIRYTPRLRRWSQTAPTSHVPSPAARSAGSTYTSHSQANVARSVTARATATWPRSGWNTPYTIDLAALRSTTSRGRPSDQYASPDSQACTRSTSKRPGSVLIWYPSARRSGVTGTASPVLVAGRLLRWRLAALGLVFAVRDHEV